MAVQTLNPTAVGFYDGFTLMAGASKVAAVTLPDDDATSYLRRTQPEGEGFQSFAMSDLPVGAISVSGHVSRMRIYTGPWNDGLTLFVRRDSADTFGTLRQNEAAWVARTDSSLGGVGTPAQINASELGVRYGPGYSAGGWGDFSTLSWDVTFQFAPGGFVCLIGQWLGPLVAVGLAEMQRLAIELYRRSGTRITLAEYEAAWRELREARHRRFYFRPAAGLYVPA